MIAEHTAVVNDLMTRYLTGGPKDAPVVVFLHDGAWGASADVTWGRVLELASADYRVVAPDLLGFGGSAKAIRLDESPFGFRMRHVHALLDSIGIHDPVHLVGNSFGGSIALRSLTDPELEARAASVTSISGTGGPWRTLASAALASFDGTDDDIRRIVELLCDEFDEIDDQVRDRSRWARMPGHYAGMMAPHVALPESMQIQRTDAYPATLADSVTPVLLFECAGDDLVEPKWTGHIADVHPATTIVEVPYRHAPNISHPTETWELVSAFLKEVAGGRR